MVKINLATDSLLILLFKRVPSFILITHLSKTNKKDPSNKVDKFDWTIKSIKQYRGINGKCNTFQSNNAVSKPKLI